MAIHNPWDTDMLAQAAKRIGGIRWGLAALLIGLPLPFIILAVIFGR